MRFRVFAVQGVFTCTEMLLEAGHAQKQGEHQLPVQHALISTWDKCLLAGRFPVCG